MASGEHNQIAPVGELPVGAALMASGRISAARYPETPVTTPPFHKLELIALDEAISEATELTLARFSVYVGDLGPDAVAGARAVLPKVPEPDHAVLIAVSPNEQSIAVVSGPAVARQVNDRICQLGVTAAIPVFRSGQLLDGIIAAVRVIAAAAQPR